MASVATTLEHFAAPLARHLEDKGWETVAAAEGASALDGFVRSYDLPPYRRRGPSALLRAFLRLRRLIKQEQPDVLHLHTPPALVIGRLAGTATGVPTVAVVHGTFLEPLSWRSVIYAVVEGLLARLAAVTVTINRDDHLFYRRVCRRTSVYQAPVGGAGIDADCVHANGRGQPGHETLLCIGRLTPEKNLDLVVEAFRLARGRVRNLRLRLVGPKSTPGDASWTAPEIRGIDRQPWTDDPLSEISSAALVVSASLREGFSMAVAEALVLGCPVVAVANRGTRELHRTAGRRLTLVDNDAAAMADAIVNCLARHHDRNVQEDLLAQWSTTAAVRFHSEKVETLVLGRGPY